MKFVSDPDDLDAYVNPVSYAHAMMYPDKLSWQVALADCWANYDHVKAFSDEPPTPN